MGDSVAIHEVAWIVRTKFSDQSLTAYKDELICPIDLKSSTLSSFMCCVTLWTLKDSSEVSEILPSFFM
jgi:hypothetical protein